MSKIEWTDRTWNVVVGCSRVSRGCEHCYAERVAHRGMSDRHRGLTVVGNHGPRWNGTVRFVPEVLAAPLSWRKAQRVFVNSMSDLFHEGVADEQIDAVLAVMLLAPQHTFQVLTKRPNRMRSYLNAPDLYERVLRAATLLRDKRPGLCGVGISNPTTMPPPWIWWGVSVEDQATADERIPVLLELPAALRFVSYEPALGPVDFRSFMWPTHWRWDGRYATPEEAIAAGARAGRHRQGLVLAGSQFVDWIIVGGESGPGARPFDLAWARSTIAQCREASVPCFVKQLGSCPVGAWVDIDGVTRTPPRLDDRKGGDIQEWPFDLRARQFPEARPA